MNYITSLEAFDILKSDSSANLVDNRTEQEWKKGYPDVDNIHKISSHLGENFDSNPDFLALLEKEIPNKKSTLIFICRTSGRSSMASQIAESDGYEDVRVVIDGFEGSAMGDG